MFSRLRSHSATKTVSESAPASTNKPVSNPNPQAVTPSSQSSNSQTSKTSTVAERVKLFNIRAAQAQTEAAQARLSLSPSSPSGKTRTQPTTPFAPDATSQSFFTSNSISQARYRSSAPAAVKTKIPGCWPITDDPHAVGPSASSVPYGVRPSKARVDSASGAGARTGSSWVPGMASSASAPTSPSIRPVASGTPAAHPLLEFKHRETQRFEAPAGPRTEYAYEHHSQARKEQHQDDYDPSLPELAHVAPVVAAARQSPGPRSDDQGISSMKSTPPGSMSSPSRGIHRFSDFDASTPWAKFRRLDKGEKKTKVLTTSTDSVIDSQAPKQPVTQPRRSTSEGSGTSALSISVKEMDNKTRPVESIQQSPAVPLSTITAGIPQAVLTLTVSQPGTVTETRFPLGADSTPAAGRGTGQQVQPSTTNPINTGSNGASNDSANRSITAADSTTKEAQASDFAPLVTEPPGVETDKAVAQPPETLPTSTQALGLLTTREILDAIILEHRAALTSITRKLSTELARLNTDYETAILPTMTSATTTKPTPTTDPAAISTGLTVVAVPAIKAIPVPASTPTIPSSSLPGPHYELVSDVIPGLSQQGRRMQELVDEVVRNAREVWCVDILPCTEKCFKCCLGCGNAKNLQIRQEQMRRARRVAKLGGNAIRSGDWGGIASSEAENVSMPRPLRLRKHGSDSSSVKSRLVAHKLDLGRTNDNDSLRAENTYDNRHGDRACILPVSVVSKLDLGLVPCEPYRCCLKQTEKPPHRISKDLDLPAKSCMKLGLVELRTANPRCLVFPPSPLPKPISRFGSTGAINTYDNCPSIVKEHAVAAVAPVNTQDKEGAVTADDTVCWNDGCLLNEYEAAGSLGEIVQRYRGQKRSWQQGLGYARARRWTWYSEPGIELGSGRCVEVGVDNAATVAVNVTTACEA